MRRRTSSLRAAITTLQREIAERQRAVTLLEALDARASPDHPSVGRERRTRGRPASDTKAANDSPPKWSQQIEQLVRDNPQGLRTYEIARRIGQSSPNAFGILKFLERHQRVVRHGERYNTLWTLPGIVPEPRIETIQAAVVHVLSKTDEPVDGRRLREEILTLLARHIGKKPYAESVKTEIARLISAGIIARCGANEHGPMYVLVNEKEPTMVN